MRRSLGLGDAELRAESVDSLREAMGFAPAEGNRTAPNPPCPIQTTSHL